MLSRTLILLLMLISNVIFSQKVDLDRFNFNVAYQKLPKMFVEFDKRTYDASATTLGTFSNFYNPESITSLIAITGWKKSSENPTVKTILSFDDFSFIKNEVQTRKVENKDKDGKVTSTSYYYSVKSWYNCKGSYIVDGPTLPKVVKDEKKDPKKEEKKEEKPVNKFLSNTVANTTPTLDTIKNSAKTNSKVIYLNTTLEDVTPEKNSSGEAIRDFNLNSQLIKDNKLKEFVNNSIGYVNNELNQYYGFPEYKTSDYLWILDSKDHPEYKDQQEAIEAVKVLFKTMKGNESLSTLETNLSPLIEYFNSLKKKYKEDDKRSRKMRYSAFFNLAKIYYYLDMPDKCIEEANGLIANDYDKSDGESLIKDANALKELFAKTKFNSRHNIPLK